MFGASTLLILVGAAFVSSHEGHQLYSVQTRNQTQKNVLYSLESTGKYEFIELTKIVDEIEPVLVPNSLTTDFENILSQNDISFHKVMSNKLRRQKFELKDGRITYDGFYGSELIEESIRNIATEATTKEDSPLRAEFFQYGTTYKGKPMNAVRIGLKKNDPKTTPVFLVDGGIHGNELIAPPAVHLIIENLLENPEALKIMEYADVVLTPCVNRDAYDESIEWIYPVMIGRKNLMPSSDGKCILKELSGTNINRNFDWFWNSADSKEDPCGYNYRGDFPHSAPETVALAGLMETPNVKYYHTVHSFGNLIMYPYGNSADPVKYFEENRAVALAGKAAVEKAFGQEYKVGSTFDILYITSGASKDYAAGKLNIPISIIHEIGGRKLDFQPLTSDIKKYCEMGWIVFYANCLEVIKYGKNLV